jgi:hypothetical protein
MSKYEDMCEAYQRARAAYIRHNDECSDLEATIGTALIDYLSIPAEKISYFAPSDRQKPVPPRDALELQEDGRWAYGVAFLLHERSGGLPTRTEALVIRIKSEETRYFVEIAGQGRTHQVDKPLGDDKEQIHAILDALCDSILMRYAHDEGHFDDSQD